MHKTVLLIIVFIIACKQRGRPDFIQDASVDSGLINSSGIGRESRQGFNGRIEIVRASSFHTEPLLLPYEIDKFVYGEYIAVDTAMGDINLDGLDDIIMILSKRLSDTTNIELYSRDQRPILVLYRIDSGRYKFEDLNKNVIASIEDGGALGDAYIRTVVENGFFSIDHYSGSGGSRWSEVVTFKYNVRKKKLYLFKIVRTEYEFGSEIKESTWVKTEKDFGAILFDQYDRARIK